MYFKRNEFEEVIPTSDLCAGMKVSTREVITYGWRQDTTLTFYHPHIIKRVTPKKTKVVCEDETEFNTRETTFFKTVPEMTEENERVKLYRRMLNMHSALDKFSGLDYVSSLEEMREAVKNFYAFYNFVKKNNENRQRKE